MPWTIAVEAELTLDQATDCNGQQQKKWCPSHLFKLEMEGEKFSNELLARETYDELKVQMKNFLLVFRPTLVTHLTTFIYMRGAKHF